MSGWNATASGYRRSTCSAAALSCSRAPRAAAAKAAGNEPEVVLHTIGEGGEYRDAEGSWQTLYGLDPDGAVLVRPDGYVGWRSRSEPGNASDELRKAVDSILGRFA